MTKSELSYRLVKAYRANDTQELQRLFDLIDKNKNNS